MEDSLIFELNGSEESYKNIDFHRNLYYYYIKGGWSSFYIEQILVVLSWVFKIVFCFIMIFIMDWDKLLECDRLCGDIRSYFVWELRMVSIIYVLICSIFIIWLGYNVKLKINSMKEIDTYVRTMIDGTLIPNLTWKQFVKKIKLTKSTDVVKYVMQYDNFMIAIVNNNIITTSIYSIPVLNYHLEKIFRYCLFSVPNFQWQSRLRLKRKFRLIALMYAITLPIILPMIILHNTAINMNMFYIKKNIVGNRRYGLNAIWQFREYNELPHFFYHRLDKSQEYAETYIRAYKFPIYNKFFKFIQIVSGSILAFILIISFIDENIITEITFYDKSLLWHLAIWGGVVAFVNGFLSGPIKYVNFKDKLIAWSQYTHHLPITWIQNANSIEIRNQFTVFYPYKIVRVFHNLCGYLCAPYILWQWGNQSSELIDFLDSNSYTDENIGTICSLARFDKNMYRFVEESILKSTSNHEFSKHGKLEKSIITFGINHKETEFNKLPQFIQTKIYNHGHLSMKPYMEWVHQEFEKKELESCLYETYLDSYIDKNDNPHISKSSQSSVVGFTEKVSVEIEIDEHLLLLDDFDDMNDDDTHKII